MLTHGLFEELLAAYPAEKRELARQVYCRFAEGDSTQFFTQLFIVLDIYAHYAERVPQAVIEANQGAHASFAKLRDRKSTRLNSSHTVISYAVFCLKKKNKKKHHLLRNHTSHRESNRQHT